MKHNPNLVSIDDSVHIDAATLLLRLEESQLLPQGGLLNYAGFADTLEEIILDSLLSYVVDTFDTKSDTAAWANYMLSRTAKLKAAALEYHIYPQIEIDSLEVVGFYDSRPDLFTRRPKVDVAHIVLSPAGYRAGPDSLIYRQMSNREIDSMIDFRLKLLKSEISDSIDFKEAASAFSLDQVNGSRGGRLGWIHQYDLHPEVETVLSDSSTALFEPIGPVRSRDGVHLFFLYGRHPGGVPPLNTETYDLAYSYLLDMKMTAGAGALIDSMRMEHPSVFNDSALLRGRDEVDRLEWVAVANGIDTVRYVTFERAMISFRMSFSNEFGLTQFRAVAQTIVDERLLVRFAVEKGLDTIPAVASAITGYRHQYSRDALNKWRYGMRYIPQAAEIAEYYEDNSEEFIVERPFKIQQILVKDSLLAEFVSALAESGEGFLELAETYYIGEPDIRRAAADLGWIGPNDFAPEVFTLLDSLIVGDVTPPIKSEYGFHIVRLLEKKHTLSLAEASVPIKKKLTSQHRMAAREEWAKLLRKNRRVTFNFAGLQGIRLSSEEDRLVMRQKRLGITPGSTFRSL